MDEPYRSQFVALIQRGAARRDIHDSNTNGEYDSDRESRVSDRFLEREIARVDMHASGLCRTLVDHVGGAERILDVGCGTGGTSVALALSSLGARTVIGVDADASTLQAARVRAQAYQLESARLSFQHVPAGHAMPYEDNSFDLVTCVSVLEFISSQRHRDHFIAELLRVLRPGGHLFLATPNPFVLHEYHSHRLLGDWRRDPGYPWSSPPWRLRRMLAGQERIPLARYRMLRHPRLRMVAAAAPLAQWAFPWQQVLTRKRQTTH